MTGKPTIEDSEGPDAGLLGALGLRVQVIQLGPIALGPIAPGPIAPGEASSLGHRLGSQILGDKTLHRLAHPGGPGLAIAAFGAAEGGLEEPAWALTVGGAVVRGLPTAARGTLTARTPLRRGVTEAQFGGDFAAFLSARLDALVVYGRSPEAVVLECLWRGAGAESGAEVRVVPAPEGFGALGLADRAASLRREFGAGIAMLAVGPGADLGLPMANVASISPRGEAPLGPEIQSFVGRGGMGQALRGTGVVAVVVHGTDPTEPGAPADGAASLRKRLLASPRLLARDVGGTLELGALREPLSDDGAAASTARPPRGQATKHGCRGCPTPCGWTFDQPVPAGGNPTKGAARIGGRFAALQGAAKEGDGGLAFLAECNELGLDARSSALIMHRLRRAGASFAGPRDFTDRSTAAFEAAMELSPDSDVEPAASHHQADLSAWVGVHRSARGPEPVRSLSVLAFSSVDAGNIVAPLPWRGEADWDAGVLAYWHECFAAAIDLSGFCAFSAAGLIADGVMDVAELSSLLAPPAGWGARSGAGARPGSDPGRAMLAAGADHVECHRRLGDASRRGGAPSGKTSLAADARARALEGYEAARAVGFLRTGPDPTNMPGPKASAEADRGAESRMESSEPGTVRVRASGLLATRLAPARQPSGQPLDQPSGASRPGGSAQEVHLECELPAPGADLKALLRSLAALHPSAAPWLIGPDGRAVPAAISEGRRLEPDAPLVPGAEIELILAIPGG